MRWAVLVVGVVACGPARAPARPQGVACNPQRIGRVTVTGATPDEVAPLAILEGTLDDPDRTTRMVALVTQMLRDRGHADARIALARRGGCGLELDVAVTLGPRYRIARIEFVTTPDGTNDGFPDGDRRALLATNLGAINAIGGVYRPDLMAEALARIQNAYYDRGWVMAKVETPVVRTGTRAGLGPSEIALRIPITAGTRFKVGAIRSNPAGPSGAAVVAALGLRRGEWFERPKLRIGLERARRRTGHRIDVASSAFIVERGEIDLELEVVP